MPNSRSPKKARIPNLLNIENWIFFGHRSFGIGHLTRTGAVLALAFRLTSAFAQTPPTNSPPPPPPSTLIMPGPSGPVRITSSGAMQISSQPANSTPDLFNSLIGSAASVDMESVVTARVEFDPPVVAAGGRATYRIVVNALDESLKLPDQLPAPNGLEVTTGGRAQSYQPSAAGRLQPQTTINYRAVATNTGAFKIPSFTATAYGKPVTVPEAHLVVVEPGTPGVREAQHLVLQLPEGDIYVGQTLRIPVMLIDPGDGSVVALQQARVNGDAIFSEPNSYGLRHDIVHQNGQAYAAFIQEVIITPMREGRQTLVAQANCISGRPVMVQPGVFQGGSTLVDSDPVPMMVKALPEDRLPGFSGAIGSFSIEPPKLSTNQVRAGDPVTLRVTVRGEGNLGRLTMPSAPRLRDWQSFPPQGDPAPPFVIQQRGYTVFSYTLIPLTEKSKATPAIPFCSFDPAKGAYVDLTIPPVPLAVTPAPAGAETKLQAAQSDTRDGEIDDGTTRERALAMTGLAETPGWSGSGLGALQQRWWFLALQLLPAGGIAGLLFWDKRRRFLEQYPEVERKRKARRGLRKQLAAARRAAAAQDARAFVTGAINALREACAPHGAANPEALVCADVLRELPATERESRGGDIVRRLFTADDAIRFGGPVRDGSELLALRPELERVLEELKARL